MNPVRPSSLPPAATGQVQRPADPARLAAQKAFFEAALGKAAAPAATATAATPVTPAAPAQRTPDPQAPQPQKILRPGSLLDIRI